MRKIIAMFATITCAALVGCEDKKTIWSEDTPSPDKIWTASARTEQYGGPGTAGLITTVRLRRSNSSQAPVDILVLERRQPTEIKVEVNWKDSSHLEITYQNADLDFQAEKCAGIEISVQNTQEKPNG